MKLEQWAPVELAASWDNVGLQIGSYDQPVSEVLIAMDADDAVLAYLENKKHGADSSPYFFKALQQVRYDQEMGVFRAFFR